MILLPSKEPQEAYGSRQLFAGTPARSSSLTLKSLEKPELHLSVVASHVSI